MRRCSEARPSAGPDARVDQPGLAAAADAVPAARADAEAARRGPTRRSSWCASQPGITIPQIAEAMKIEPNYLYRVMPRLVSDGQVRRDGQGWHPAAKS